MSHDEQTFLSMPKYPAFLDLQQSCWILGLKLHQGQILVGKKALVPAGKRKPRKSLLFVTAYVLELAEDRDWLSKAKDLLSAHWEKCNARKRAKRQKAETTARNKLTERYE